MAAPPVKIRIGAALDASLDRSLRSAAQKIGQAEKSIQRQKRQTTQAVDREAKAQLKAQQQLAKAAEQLDRQRARGLYQQFRAQERAAEQASRAQQRAVERQHAAERREIERTRRLGEQALRRERQQREQAERVAARRHVRERELFARRTSHRTTRFLLPEAPLGSMAARALGGAARGMGVDFSVQGAVGRIVELERRAQDLANSGFQANGTGPNARRIDRRELVGQARQVGGSLGIDSLEVLSALEQFQKITGDLDMGRKMLGDMAKLAKATGTSLDDMAAATANVSNGLGDVPNKAELIDQVMRTIAGQGKLGAVELSDMATQMARVAASASAFAGDAGENIGKIGALAQIARAEGGAPSAAEASRSVVGFANTMKKSARIEAFKKQGINVFTDDTQTKLKDPISLIKESLLTTGGDLQEMNKMFMDVIGARSVAGLQKTFVGAGGGEAGLAAVDKLVNRMIEAQVSRQEVDESARRAGDTVSAKAARFQNELDQVTEGVMAKLAPALEEASPAILKFAQVIGDVSTWAVSNPKLAIAGGIAAALARAGIESAFRAGIERVINRIGGVAPGSGVGPRGGPAPMGKLGAAGMGVGLGVTAATAITASGIGGFEASESRMRSEGERLLSTLNSTDPAEIKRAIREQRASVFELQKGDWADHTPVIGDVWNWATNANETKGVEKRTAETNLKRMEEYLAALTAEGTNGVPGAVAEQMEVSSREQIDKLQQSIGVQQQMLEQLQAIAGKEQAPGDAPLPRQSQ